MKNPLLNVVLPRVGRQAACLLLGMAMLSQTARSAPDYATAVLADTPLAFWQLNENVDTSVGGAQAIDASGNGLNATYGTTSLNGYYGIQGPQPPSYLGFTNMQGAVQCSAGDVNSPVTVPALNLNTNAVTIAMWINPSGGEATFAGLLMNRNSSGDAAGLGFGGSQDVNGMAELGYTWNANNANTYNFNSGLYPVAGIWQFVVLVIQSNSATIYLDYTNSSTGELVLSSAVNPIAHTAEAFASGATFIGADVVNGSTPDTTRGFSGGIAGVAVYKSALTSDQVLALFAAGVGTTGFPPTITGQPKSQFVLSGSPVTFSATGINGTSPISYQWQLNGTNVNLLPDAANFTGANSNVLQVLSATAVDAGSYQLIVNNALGMTVSSNATLAIQTPRLVGQWLTNNTLADVSGYQPAGTHDGYDINGTGSYVFTNDVPPSKTGQSLMLLYGDTGIAISNSSSFDANYTNTFDEHINNSFTVGCFAKGWPGAWSPFVSKYGENGLGWQLREYGVNGVSPCWTIRGTGQNDDMGATAVNLASDTNNWHFYVGTYDAATRVRNLYVDGVLRASETNNGVYAMAPASHLCIGARDAGTNTFGSYFTGEIYDVRVYNYALTATQVVTWYGIVSPEIASQPVSTAVFDGTKASFNVTASGTPPLTYQWQLNGTNVNLLPDAANFTGANSNVLTVLSVTTNDVGSYSVVVNSTLGYGSATSSNAVLSIVAQALVGEWFTNGTLTDLSQYTPPGTHDAYPVGSGIYTFTNDVPPGESGQSIQFSSASDSGVAIANSATTDGATYTNTFDIPEFTVAFWAKDRGAGGAPWIAWVAKDGYNNDGEYDGIGWSVGIEAWSQHVYFDMEGIDGGSIAYTLGDGLWGNGILESSPQNLPGDNNWHHYATTYSPVTGVRRLYFDGTLVAEQTGNVAYRMAPDKHLTIASQEQTTTGFTGFSRSTMFDVRFYNYALSANEVAALLPHPQITGQPPKTLNAYVGVTAQLGATVTTFNKAVTNQWQLNGTNLVDGAYGGAYIMGATSNVLTILDTTTNLQGVYNLVISYAGGSQASSNSTITVLQPEPAPATNVVGAWLAGGATLADVSGYQPAGTHDGYGVNGTGVPSQNYAFTNDVPPGAPAGMSLWLPTGNAAIAISNSSTLDMNYTNTFDDNLTNAFSVTFWAKGYPGNWAPWVSKYGEGPGWQMRDEGDTAHSGFTLRGAGGTVALGQAVYGNPDDNRGTIPSNNTSWHHYAGTYDSVTGVRNWYVDGVLSGQVTNCGPYNLDSEEHLTIGGKDSPPGNAFGSFFTGEIYGVRIYDTALSEAQVNSLIPPAPLPQTVPMFSGPPILLGNKFMLSWTSGSLLESTNLTGPWTIVPGATSPFTNDTTTSPQMFYKLSQ